MAIRDVVEHDGQDTVLANHVQYDNFGNPTESTAPIADFLFAFTGRPLDPDTGLYELSVTLLMPPSPRTTLLPAPADLP